MLRSLMSGRFALLGGDPPPPGPKPAPKPSSSKTAAASENPQPFLVEYQQKEAQAGLLVTAELDAAYERVKAKVEEIARECRARNSKFRDIEFDLEEDKERSLHSLATPAEDRSTPADVRRVSQAFSKPKFFVDGASESDVVQGELGDCWLLSGMAAVAAMPGLIDKVCVARDERVGVYGFIFMRDGIWRDVIIDDLLYTSIPRYEELSGREKQLYHSDKDRYNKAARLGSKSLYFAKSGTENETWVPLLEKAYAKLHGDYASLSGGKAGEAIEDLTGGVTTYVHLNDILDPDLFWETELLRANKDRLFSCSIYGMAGTPGVPVDDNVNGLYTNHAYSILKAIEYNGKRFLRIRNPWGNSEWTGRWSDGSKEWTSEWLSALDVLGHTFGDDGAFIMEYEDFLDTWTLCHRVRLFDPSWIQSSLWINAQLRGPVTAWDYGDVSFTFKMPVASPAIIVLAQLDDRFFKELSGSSSFTLDFKLFKKGDKKVLVSSSHSTFFGRSVNAELDLEAGEYVVHVRVDRVMVRPKDYVAQNAPNWDARKLAAVLSRGAISTSIVSNFNADKYDHLLPRSIETFAGRDLHEVELEAHERFVKKRQGSTPAPTKGDPKPPSADILTADEAPSGEVTSGSDELVMVVNGDSSVDVGTVAPEVASASMTPSETVTAVPPGRSPASSLVEELAKKVAEENEVIANGAKDDASEPPAIPTFKEVPGVGLVPESMVSTPIANGDGAKTAESETKADTDTTAPDAEPKSPGVASRQTTTEDTVYLSASGSPSAEDPAALPDVSSSPKNQEPSSLPNGKEHTEGRNALLDASLNEVGTNLPQASYQQNGHVVLPLSPSVSGLKPSAAGNHAVHQNISCDGTCGQTSIHGDRFKCLVCPSYDLCSTCLAAGQHTPTGHPLVRIPKPEDGQRIIQEARGTYPGNPNWMPGSIAPMAPMSPVSPRPRSVISVREDDGPAHMARCDNCGKDPIRGIRYKCMEIPCPDFDLCADCHNEGVTLKDHLPTHRMIAIAKQEDAEHLHADGEADEDNELAIGLRVYTKKDCQTEIKGQLRHGKVIRWRHE